jgi:hypothetical protein
VMGGVPAARQAAPVRPYGDAAGPVAANARGLPGKVAEIKVIETSAVEDTLAWR